MNFKQIAAVGMMTATITGFGLVGLGATGAGAATTTSEAPTPSTCLPAGHADAWPAWTNGRPARDPGVRLWHDTDGWHLRVTHKAIHDRVFSGVIQTRGTLVGVHSVRLEKNDYVKVGSDGHTLRFRFNNYGGTDGIDFGTHCAPFLRFGFTTDGHVLAPAHISIGAAGRHPAHNPFVIRRTA
jgi:hypothetical protein